MAKSDTKILDKGSFFPSIEFKALDDTLISLPKDFNGKWNILLLYRGYW